MENERNNLDRLIDGALASYSGAEPLEGLERRVLNRLGVVRARRRMLAWGLGFAVMASIVVAGIVVRPERRVVEPKRVLTADIGAAQSTPAAMKPVHKIRHWAHMRKPRALPKLEQFPTPTPMTAEERALVAFVEHDPKEAQQVFSDLRKRSEEPVKIQSIKIAPLKSDDAQ